MPAPGCSCGECKACCIRFAIEEIDKPENTPCRYLDQAAGCEGCTIYQRRPVACRDYECAWLMYGLGIEADRPDRSGVIVDGRPTRFGVMYVAKAMQPGACETVKGVALIKRFAEDDLVAVADDDDVNHAKYLVGPPTLVKQFRQSPLLEQDEWVEHADA